MSQDLAEQNVQIWKLKKLIKSLESARRCAPLAPSTLCLTAMLNRDQHCSPRTSMISLIIPPGVRLYPPPKTLVHHDFLFRIKFHGCLPCLPRNMIQPRTSNLVIPITCLSSLPSPARTSVSNYIIACHPTASCCL